VAQSCILCNLCLAMAIICSQGCMNQSQVSPVMQISM